jgi:hypothetical protein
VSLAALERDAYCDAADASRCDELCVCAVPQLHGTLAERCRNEPDAEDIAGWCYVAPEQGLGDREQLAMCSAEQARTVRLFGLTSQPDNVFTLSCYEP